MPSEDTLLPLAPPSRVPGELASEYLAVCEREKLKPNALLFKRLDLALTEHKKGKPIALACVGSEKETFLQRLSDVDMLVLLESLNNKGARLRHLDLSFHSLADEIGDLFVSFSRVTETLESLRLKSNLFSESGAQRLCIALAKCRSLSLLDLSNNRLGKEGGKAAAFLIGQLQSLKALDLSDCQLDLEAFVHLSTAIQADNKVIHPKS